MRNRKVMKYGGNELQCHGCLIIQDAHNWHQEKAAAKLNGSRRKKKSGNFQEQRAHFLVLTNLL